MLWAGLRQLYFDSVSDSRGTRRLVGKRSEADGWCVPFLSFLSFFSFKVTPSFYCNMKRRPGAQ